MRRRIENATEIVSARLVEHLRALNEFARTALSVNQQGSVATEIAEDPELERLVRKHGFIWGDPDTANIHFTAAGLLGLLDECEAYKARKRMKEEQGGKADEQTD